MTESDIARVALEVLLDHLEKGPRFSQVAAKISDYTGDGQSLEDAMRVQLEVEDMLEDLLDGISQGLRGK